jgi:hypothetical protein
MIIIVDILVREQHQRNSLFLKNYNAARHFTHNLSNRGDIYSDREGIIASLLYGSGG